MATGIAARPQAYPLWRALANAPPEDEEISEEKEPAVRGKRQPAGNLV
jgi:hypothetical protein